MGIKDFHKCIKQRYPKAFSTKLLESYDHLLVDINFALHYCSYGANSEEDIYNRLYVFFDYLLQDITPTKSITVASDGVAPLAKLVLQRKRRLNISKIAGITKDFSTLIFTPGTEFMINLESKLKNYFKYVENSYCIKINYMDSVNDEAELKLKQKIQEIQEINYNDSFIFVTNDADVIAMLATLKNTSNVYVYNRSSKENEIISMGKLLDEHTKDVGMTMTYGNDFCLISTMLGNDYIPKINCIDYNKIWLAYKKLSNIYKTGLIDDNCIININFFSDLMKQILINLKKGFIKKIKIDEIDPEIYKDYFDGLTWCYNMYKTGKCTRYNYMYENDFSPNPLGIICALQINKQFINLDKSINEPTNVVLYGILALPKSSKKLIQNKYHKFIEQSNKLYEQEDCKKCTCIYDKIYKFHELIAKEQISNDNIEEYKIKIRDLSKQLSIHKKNHKDLNFNDIKNITNAFNLFY